MFCLYIIQLTEFTLSFNLFILFIFHLFNWHFLFKLNLETLMINDYEFITSINKGFQSKAFDYLFNSSFILVIVLSKYVAYRSFGINSSFTYL